jgi:hypothetical protein
VHLLKVIDDIGLVAWRMQPIPLQLWCSPMMKNQLVPLPQTRLLRLQGLVYKWWGTCVRQLVWSTVISTLTLCIANPLRRYFCAGFDNGDFRLARSNVGDWNALVFR